MADGRTPTGSRDRAGVLFVMTGASGVGKDTIRHAAMPHIDNLEFSISATTRERRAGEQDGVQYHFIDRPRFERMIEEDAFLEYADYVGDYYGTPAGPVEQALAEGRDVLLELELVGARQVKRRVPEAVMIFIALRAGAPPARARHRQRGEDPEAPGARPRGDPRAARVRLPDRQRRRHRGRDVVPVRHPRRARPRAAAERRARGGLPARGVRRPPRRGTARPPRVV